jgi:hypothetical protein
MRRTIWWNSSLNSGFHISFYSASLVTSYTTDLKNRANNVNLFLLWIIIVSRCPLDFGPHHWPNVFSYIYDLCYNVKHTCEYTIQSSILLSLTLLLLHLLSSLFILMFRYSFITIFYLFFYYTSFVPKYKSFWPYYMN